MQGAIDGEGASMSFWKDGKISSKELISSSRIDSNNSNNLGITGNSDSSANLDEGILKDCGVIDTAGWNPTPATMKLLFELKVLRKRLDILPSIRD